MVPDGVGDETESNTTKCFSHQVLVWITLPRCSTPTLKGHLNSSSISRFHCEVVGLTLPSIRPKILTNMNSPCFDGFFLELLCEKVPPPLWEISHVTRLWWSRNTRDLTQTFSSGFKSFHQMSWYEGVISISTNLNFQVFRCGWSFFFNFFVCSFRW